MTRYIKKSGPYWEVYYINEEGNPQIASTFLHYQDARVRLYMDRRLDETPALHLMLRNWGFT